MCKIIIDSKVSELDTSILADRLENLCEALKSHFRTVYVSIQLKCEIGTTELSYRCEVEGVSLTAGRLIACSEHSNLMQALRLAVSNLGQSLSLERLSNQQLAVQA